MQPHKQRKGPPALSTRRSWTSCQNCVYVMFLIRSVRQAVCGGTLSASQAAGSGTWLFSTSTLLPSFLGAAHNTCTGSLDVRASMAADEACSLLRCSNPVCAYAQPPTDPLMLMHERHMHHGRSRQIVDSL